jgi:hypothetical protein
MESQPSQRSTVQTSLLLGGSQCYLTLKRACKKCPNRCQGGGALQGRSLAGQAYGVNLGVPLNASGELCLPPSMEPLPS